MVERRPLTSALKPAVDVDPAIAKEFVYGGEKPKSERTDDTEESHSDSRVRNGKAQPTISRVPFTTRLRTDFGSALKRASLERQLNSQFPHTLQDILEEALEPWLRANGYIK
jgi:hypothetical protein